MSGKIIDIQSSLLAQLNREHQKLKRDYDNLRKERDRLVGILVGVLYQYGDAKNLMLRIKKKFMMKTNPAWMIFPEIDNVSKDLVVRFLDKNIGKGGGVCRSTTTNAKGAENNSKCGTSESTTTQKSAQDAEPQQDESTTPNNT